MNIAIVLCVAVALMTAQELPDSRGTDFWFCFIPNYHNNGIDDPLTYSRDSLFIFVAADEPTDVTLRYTTYPGNQQRELRRRINDPNQMLIIGMSYYGVELIGYNGGGFVVNPLARHTQRPVPYSLHLTSEREVTVYAMSHAEKTSEAFMVLPTDALGKDYYVMSYNVDVYSRWQDTPSQFAIVATEDSTVVELLNVTAPTTEGRVSRVLLNQGEVYLVQSLTTRDSYDLTGSRIKANRPIAVFGGHQRVRVPLASRNISSSRDCLIEQLPPINTWGRSALLVPYPDPPDDRKLGTDRFRIIAARDSTVIYLDSMPLLTLNAGQYYEGALTAPHSVHANRPIMVAQFRRTSSAISSVEDYNLGDPFMMIIPPTEQFLTGYRFVCPRIYEDSTRFTVAEVYKYHYVTIVVPDSAKESVEVDGRALAASVFRPIPKSEYVYAWVRLSAGVHTVRAGAPVGIYVYGYGYADSYGYVGGMSYRRYDFDPPKISSLPVCPPYRLVVYDTLPGDSRVDVVRIVEDSTNNVSWSINRRSLLPEDSVEVALSLIDPFEDGQITLVAEDAEQFVTHASVFIPGMTVRVLQTDGSVVRPPATFRYRSATQRSTCFPVQLINTGKSPQTITHVHCQIGTITSDSLPLVLLPGDTILLNVCYRSQTTAAITDTLWFDTPCGRYTAAVFDVEFIVDTLPPRILRADQPCPPTSVLTIQEHGYTETGIARITVLDSFNVTIRLSGPTSGEFLLAEEQTLTITQRDWRLDAWYAIEVRDSADNRSTIAGTFEGHTVMISNRDSLNPQQTFIGSSNQFYCDTVELYNFGRYPKTFDRLTSHGVEVSVPPGYLPVVIGPGERVRIPVCVLLPFYQSGERNVYHDTVELSFGCVVRRMPVTVTVHSPSYSALSACGVPIRAGSDESTVTLLHDGSGVRIVTGSDVNWNVALYSLGGQCHYRSVHRGPEIYLPMDERSIGIYLVVLESEQVRLHMPLLWTGQ
jgi:hypothetical protein